MIISGYEFFQRLYTKRKYIMYNDSCSFHFKRPFDHIIYLVLFILSLFIDKDRKRCISVMWWSNLILWSEPWKMISFPSFIILKQNTQTPTKHEKALISLALLWMHNDDDVKNKTSLRWCKEKNQNHVINILTILFVKQEKLFRAYCYLELFQLFHFFYLFWI